MKKVLFILMMWNSFHAVAQFGQAGASWIYNDLVTSTQQNFPRGIVTIGDTAINGQVCHILIGACNCGTSQTNYVYEANRRVYWYNPALNDFALLYDFNLNAGESWTVIAYNTTSDSLRIHVDSLGVDTINGVLCKIQYAHTTATYGTPYVFDGPVIEWIGSLFCLYPQYVNCTEPTMGLRCYSDNFLGLYDTHFAPECEEVFVDSGIGIDENKFEAVYELSPNPFHSETVLRLKNNQTAKTHFRVYDITGRKVQDLVVSASNEIIRREELQDGIYFYQLISDRVLGSGKLIIY